jgi:KTSC domain
MNSTTVASATLATIAYDDAQRLLQVEFRSGAVYQYFGVPPAVHQALLGAPSKGSYFNQSIRGQFAFVRLAAPGADTQLGQRRPGGTSWHEQ